MAGSVTTGSCNCGGVKYTISGPLREVVACHCGQCRKQTGLFYAATDTLDANIDIVDDGSLKWYAASDFAKRGFCGVCGSALFWKRDGSDRISILAGSLDGDMSDIKMERHIFVEDKGSFYDLKDGLEQFAQSDDHTPRPDPNTK